MKTFIVQPELFYFANDGVIPNSQLPLLVYRQVFTDRGNKAASGLEEVFAKNAWTNSWRNGIFSYHHYHSNTHEVLGIYEGRVLAHLGGENGEKITLLAGDVIIIPAGVGHKNLESENLGVVGAYPDGAEPDLWKEATADRQKAEKNIQNLPLPGTDPLTGKKGGLREIWTKIV